MDRLSLPNLYRKVIFITTDIPQNMPSRKSICGYPRKNLPNNTEMASESIPIMKNPSFFILYNIFFYLFRWIKLTIEKMLTNITIEINNNAHLHFRHAFPFFLLATTIPPVAAPPAKAIYSSSCELKSYTLNFDQDIFFQLHFTNFLNLSWTKAQNWFTMEIYFAVQSFLI